ncbi:Protein of unknown function DUF2225 (plasmid) [Gemmatirosa kalamazoonensis]|uniref:DUF2225 domain-containing protein n=1 Tax=Gemmatirosa kalamazoonensis TaxID=861299 RepID=W0RNI6_9BACT|nr:DUF2225 domain-containing protein [Gemmatirosa kalamazoonensis]AHG92579.1 Protein of unknown function DUF2225 [Gemmatirosa kalamazoonensis]
MRASREITLQCPVCGTWFSAAAPEESDARARTSTDFHRRVDGPEPVAYLVALCGACGFAGPRDDFACDVVTGASTAALDGVMASRGDRVAASEKYEAAADIAARRGDGDAAVADLLLRAAWCCIDEGDVEAERFFRRRAARTFERALALYDEVARERRAVVTYLVGELWRRAGDAARARARGSTASPTRSSTRPGSGGS